VKRIATVFVGIAAAGVISAGSAQAQEWTFYDYQGWDVEELQELVIIGQLSNQDLDTLSKLNK